MQKGVFKVLGVSGNNHLGGDDFDLAIAKELSISKFEAKKIKEEICSQNINKSLSLTKFEELISAKIGETISLTQNLLEDLDIDEDDVKGIILVGGSSRIPLIRKKLMEIFSSEKILTNLDPDRVVAIGAAHQANSLMGNSDNLLLDVNALSLGIEMMGGIVEKIIQRNSTIPTAYAKEFTTYADNQTGMKFHIVQGERELAKNCRSLANFEIKGIPAMKAGIAKILVTFKLDADGLLTVSAEEKTTKIKQEIEVKPTFSLDENQVKEMLLDSLKNSKDDIQERLLIEAATEANQDLVIIENDIKNGLVEKEEKEKILEKLEKLRLAITQKNSREEIIQAQEELGKISENLVLSKVNEALSKKIAGKNIDEV
jgi:molecular chaperone HscA